MIIINANWKSVESKSITIKPENQMKTGYRLGEGAEGSLDNLGLDC